MIYSTYTYINLKNGNDIMKKTALKKYASLIVSTGAAVRRGQDVVINAALDQPEFVTYVVEACYKAGARKVTVDWHHQPISKLHIKYRSQKVLGTLEDWEVARARREAELLPAYIYLTSDDPDGMRGINQEKLSKATQEKQKILKPIRDGMENKHQWCIAAVPGVEWAKKVFPNESKPRAVEHLWEAILAASRADGDDPTEAWRLHNADLASRCEYLNKLGIRKLHYKSQNGTDFTVGLMENGVFLGGGEYTLGSRIFYNPNIPSEECFTTPMKGEAEGVLVATKPLSVRGQLVENFSVRFEGGRAVEVKAEKGEDLLKQLLAMDEGASYLGEVALVPYDSPINNTGILFYNTLFDENACCHVALGRGFNNCVADYEKYSFDEIRAMGVNDSIIHVDFMIGAPDLTITAQLRSGEETLIFKDGNWAF